MCKMPLILTDNKKINKTQSLIPEEFICRGKRCFIELELKIVLKYFSSYIMVCVCTHVCFLWKLGGSFWYKAQNFILKSTLSIHNLGCSNICWISVTLKDPFCCSRILSIWDVRRETVLLHLIFCPSAFSLTDFFSFLKKKRKKSFL